MDKILSSVDVVFNALNEYGSDGRISQMLDRWGIPHTGSSPLSSHVSQDVSMSRMRLNRLGLRTPKHLLCEAYLEDMDGPRDTYPMRKAQEIFRIMPPPWIVRPVTKGSSMGIHVAKTLPELVRAFDVAMNEKVSTVVEELIEGKHTSISVLDNFRNQPIYTFFCVDNLSGDEKREIENLAIFVHDAMKLDKFSQIHFIVHPKRGAYIKEIKTIPEFHEGSPLLEHISSVGSSVGEFIDHMLGLALKNR